MCERCAHSIGTDRDLCPLHSRRAQEEGVARRRTTADSWLDALKAEDESESADNDASQPRHECVFDDGVCILCDAARNTPIGDKVAHVRNANQLRDHTCHWPGCKRQVKPALWGCTEHWKALPQRLRSAIWATYRIGQEETMSPSREYLRVADEVQHWIVATFGGEDKQRDDGGAWERAVRHTRERDAQRASERLYCGVCHGVQYETPSGLVCNAGHGGAPSMTEAEVRAELGISESDDAHA